MKPKTPEQLAQQEKGKTKYTLYLDVEAMEYIQQRAAKAGTSASKIVNEAISSYVQSIKDRKSD